MKILRQTRSALERQVTESVIIQEEQRDHYLMNSKSEYNRCSLPRLTAKLGSKDYDKIRQDELEEEKREEQRVREEIRTRRKERCKLRNQELHPREQDERENKSHKRRKLEETGEYKTVYQVQNDEKRVRKNSRTHADKEPEIKRRKKLQDENNGVPEHLMDTGWQERRKQILESREQEERVRTRRIEMARRLEEGWRLTRICKEYIRENSNTWQELDDRREQAKLDQERNERLDKARRRKDEFLEKRRKEEKLIRIDEMLKELPRDEKEQLEYEMRKRERKEYIEMKQNLWRKWRGEQAILERKNKIPTEMEKIDNKIAEIDKKLSEMKEAEEKAKKRAQKKRKIAEENKQKKERLKNHWIMMAWLTNFIEKNKFNWERRRILQENADVTPSPTPPSNNPLSPRNYLMQKLEGHPSSIPVDGCPDNKPSSSPPTKNPHPPHNKWTEWRTGEDDGLETLRMMRKEAKKRQEVWRKEKESLRTKPQLIENEEWLGEDPVAKEHEEGGKKPVCLDGVEQGLVKPLDHVVQVQREGLVSDREHGQSQLSMDPAIHKEEKSLDGKEQGESLGPVLHELGGSEKVPYHEIELSGIDSLCFECVMIPCVCELTILTGKLELLKDERDRKRELQGVPDKEEEAGEEVPEPQVKIEFESVVLITREEEYQVEGRQEDPVHDRKLKEREEDLLGQGTARMKHQEQGLGSKYPENIDNSSQEELGNIWRRLMKKKTSSEEGKVSKNRSSKKTGDRKTDAKKTDARKTPTRNRSIRDVMKLWHDRDKEEQEVNRKQKTRPSSPLASQSPDQEHHGQTGQETGGRVGGADHDVAGDRDSCENVGSGVAQVQVQGDVVVVELDRADAVIHEVVVDVEPDTRDIVDRSDAHNNFENTVDQVQGDVSSDVVVEPDGVQVEVVRPDGCEVFETDTRMLTRPRLDVNDRHAKVYRTPVKLSKIIPEKRKESPCEKVQVPVKKRKNTPLVGKGRKSENLKIKNHNLITKHFQPISVAPDVGGGHRDEVLDGGGGVSQAVPRACASLENGQSEGGKPTHFVTDEMIGLNNSAAGILSNTGGCNNS